MAEFWNASTAVLKRFLSEDCDVPIVTVPVPLTCAVCDSSRDNILHKRPTCRDRLDTRVSCSVRSLRLVRPRSTGLVGSAHKVDEQLLRAETVPVQTKCVAKLHGALGTEAPLRRSRMRRNKEC